MPKGLQINRASQERGDALIQRGALTGHKAVAGVEGQTAQCFESWASGADAVGQGPAAVWL